MALRVGVIRIFCLWHRFCQARPCQMRSRKICLKIDQLFFQLLFVIDVYNVVEDTFAALSIGLNKNRERAREREGRTGKAVRTRRSKKSKTGTFLNFEFTAAG